MLYDKYRDTHWNVWDNNVKKLTMINANNI